MATKVFEGFQYGYCEKFDESRQFKIKMVEDTALGNRKFYNIPYFNCPEQGNCEYFVPPQGCSFTVNALERFAGDS